MKQYVLQSNVCHSFPEPGRKISHKQGGSEPPVGEKRSSSFGGCLSDPLKKNVSPQHLGLSAVSTNQKLLIC